MSIHDGHRERLKKQFLKVGLDGFAEVNVLEMVSDIYPMDRADEAFKALASNDGSLAKVLIEM